MATRLFDERCGSFLCEIKGKRTQGVTSCKFTIALGIPCLINMLGLYFFYKLLASCSPYDLNMVFWS